MKFVDNRPDTKKVVKHEIPKMPEGYYSGDKPNPNLRKFVEDHMRGHPYNPVKDDYNVPAFDKPIDSTKATAIYNMHTYWSKKPHDAIREYIQHYTKPDDLVLDPFCGSGGTALAALIDGRAAIAIDRSPAATFITKGYCTPVDVHELRAAFEELKAKVKPEIDWLYETRCDRCGGKAITAYTVYSQVFQCPRCLNKIPINDCIEEKVEKGTKGGGKGGKKKYCPICYKNGIQEQIVAKGNLKLGSTPVMVNYLCLGKCSPKRSHRKYNDDDPRKREFFNKFDLPKINEINEKEIPYWYPNNQFIRGDRFYRDGLQYNGIDTVANFFTKRNLWALAIYNKYIDEEANENIREILKFALNSSIFNCSRMLQESAWGGALQRGTYYIPPVNRESPVPITLEYKIKDLINGYSSISIKTNKLNISCQSATDLMAIRDNSVDYIFTDPPYASNVQYGELNFLWESWLKLDYSWISEEIIVNEVRGILEIHWKQKMTESMNECLRTLKPNHWISLCFHDASGGTWAFIQDIMAEVGFIPDFLSEVLFIDTHQKSQNQLTADKVTKRDLVINFRKPRPGEVTGTLTITGEEDSTTFSQKVTAIIREYLNTHPGTTKDRIYDEVVSRMVRAGQMEAHNFEELLIRVAEPNKPEGSTSNGLRWYLKETELTAVDTAETAKEDAAAEKVAKFITEFLKKHPEDEGIHYSDIFEHYIFTVKDKPRRALVDWLSDYLYKTEEGTYRLPITEEENKIKKEGRAKGIARRIRHYLAHLEQGVPIREQDRPSDATLVEWLRHCRRASLYEQGKILFEKGGIKLEALSEKQQIDVEEDYTVCVRTIARDSIAGTSLVKKSRKKKSNVIQI